MPVYLLSPALVFPDPEEAEDGLIAVGADLSMERLLLAYRSGIFPWYEEGLPIMWHSPDPRCVLLADAIHVGRSLRKVLRRGYFSVRYDTAFEKIIDACKGTSRSGQRGTWITEEMRAAYVSLHELGFAHSVEVYVGDNLVGGLYGVSLGHMFFGESMFSWVSDASKVALVGLAERLRGWGHNFIDAQVATDHTLGLGAEEWPRTRYLEVLSQNVDKPTQRGSWRES
ncbi:MAG: leucyl/phenylalanyl-tRNA--protein transferase [Myxococcales bacterium]